MLRKLLIPVLFALAGCNSTSTPFEVPTRGVAPIAPTQAPTIRVPASPAPTPAGNVTRSNTALASDFMALTFALESGAYLPRFTRFEGPISVRISGPASQTTRTDMTGLLARLRSEAGINITETSSGAANINFEMVSRAQIQKLIPNAACFVAPNVRSLNEYAANQRTTLTRWSHLTERRVMSIFVPADSSPKEIRDCMHEELAQALGPVNDLFSLGNSVFNDDNIHSTLTSFDMLMLRVHYDRDLKNGMIPNQVAERLPAILARLNPAGEQTYGAAPAGISPRWNDSINAALGGGTSTADRIRAAERAVIIAGAEGFNDVRMGFSHFVLGRLTMSTDSAKSQRAFLAADRAYGRVADTSIHRAFVASYLAAFTLNDGDVAETLGLVRPAINAARKHQNQALLSTLMMIEAEALELAGNAAAARSVRLDSLAYARYGFGSQQAVDARQKEIAALSPS